MRQLDIVKKAMALLPGSYINRNNELILVPVFNVYTCLDDVGNEDDFKVKLCEWFSRDCCCALRYQSEKRLSQYYERNTMVFNKLCKTDFSVDDMRLIYGKLGNGINRPLAEKFVGNDFALDVLNGKKEPV